MRNRAQSTRVACKRQVAPGGAKDARVNAPGALRARTLGARSGPGRLDGVVGDVPEMRRGTCRRRGVDVAWTCRGRVVDVWSAAHREKLEQSMAREGSSS